VRRGRLTLPFRESQLFIFVTSPDVKPSGDGNLYISFLAEDGKGMYYIKFRIRFNMKTKIVKINL
jgi:hypothetical protein